MSGKYTNILASDYNSIQTTVAALLGDPTAPAAPASITDSSSTTGWGQTHSSSLVSGPPTSNVITALQWHNLRLDILKAWYHVFGTDYSGSLPEPYNVALGSSYHYQISESDRAAYALAAQTLSSNKFAVASNQLTVTPYTQTYAGGWNTQLSQGVTATFNGYTNAGGQSVSAGAAARYFFNAGGTIRFSASIASPTGLKDSAWQAIFNNMGTIVLSANGISQTGNSSSTATIQQESYFGTFLSTPVVIFRQNVPSAASDGGIYLNNYYQISASFNPTTCQFSFLVQWVDAVGRSSNPTYGYDVVVNGTISSTVQISYPTTSYVSVNPPTLTANTITALAND